MKKIISLLMCFVIVFGMAGCMTSCSNASNNTYISKGEFFALFIEKTSIYPLNNTTEEMEETEGFYIEAQTMIDWDLLPEKLANANLESNVTKEIVTYACINNIYFVKTGDISEIKDADLCEDAQAVANAIASGLIELENGYFDARTYMTEQQCIEMIEKSIEIDSNGHFEEGTGALGINYDNENLVVIEEDCVISEAVEQATTNTNNFSSENVTVKRLSEVSSLSPDIVNVNEESKIKTFKISKAKLGDKSLLLDTIKSGQWLVLPNNNIYGKVVSIKKTKNIIGAETFLITLEVDDEKAIREEVVIAKTYRKTLKMPDINITGKVDGYAYEVKNSGSGITAEISKTFSVSQNQYGDWRDATASPTAKLTCYLSDVTVDAHNIKDLIEKTNNTGMFRVSYNTTQTFNCEAEGLRYTPTNNGNGHFGSNFRRSRFTNGAGAKAIKIKSFSVPIGSSGFSIKLTLQLLITMDGSVTVVLTNASECGVRVQGNQLKYFENSVKQTELEIQLNLDIGVRLKVELVYALFNKPLVGAYCQPGMIVNANVYCYEDEKMVTTCCASPHALQAELAKNDTYHSCINVTFTAYVEVGLLSDNIIGSACKKLGLDLSTIKKRFTPSEPNLTLHFEDVLNKVPKCTRGLEEGDNNIGDIDVSDDNKFHVSTYKVVLNNGEFSNVFITEMPITAKKLQNNFKGKIFIKSKDSNICSVCYNELTNSIEVQANGVGSTEVEVYVKNSKTKKKQYSSYFSVTVNGDLTTNTSLDILKLESESLGFDYAI